MYQLLIADDEPLVLVGIKTMLENNDLDIEIAATARNGQIAIDKIKELKPDIVLLDINMPLINGLDVARKAIDEMDHPPFFIMITSHDDFHYVRDAMRMNHVVDYLIKLEIDRSSLLEALSKAIDKIAKAQYQKNENSANTQNFDMNTTTMIDQYFLKLINRWFVDKQEQEDMLSCLGNQFVSNQYRTLLIKAFDIPDTQSQQDSLCKHMTYLLQSTLGQQFQCHILAWGSCEAVVCLSINRDALLIPSQLTACMQQVHDDLVRFLNCKIRIGVGCVISDMNNLSTSLDSAMFALLGSQDALCYGQSTFEPSVLDTMAIQAQLAAALESLNVQQITDCFSQIREALLIFHGRFAYLVTTCSRLLHFLSISISNPERLFAHCFDKDINPFSIVDQLHTPQEVDQWLEQLLNGVTAWIEEEFDRNRNWLVPAIKQYIEAHISDPLTLNSVAQAFEISSGYVSMLFKRYNDAGFGECVLRGKIKHAKRLLIETNMNICDISAQLGYSDPYYFSKVYKKGTGMSPREYRLSHRNIQTP